MPRTSRVVACLGGGRTAIEKREVAEPRARELLVRMRCSGLCGTDIFKLATGRDGPGLVLGHEIVGEVLSVGSEVSRFAVGDRVVTAHHVSCGACDLCERGSETMCPTFRDNLLDPGGFSDVIRVLTRATDHTTYRIPDSLSDEVAVFMEPAACVLRGVRKSRLSPGAACVILGGGSMGLLHLLVLRAVLPSLSTLLVDPLSTRRELATRLGANVAAAPGDALQEIQKLTGSRGADGVFDTVGGCERLREALSLCRPGGTVTLFAHAPEGAFADFDLNELFKHEKRIIGTYSGSLKEQAETFSLLESGRLDPSPLVTHKLPLDSFEEGVRLAREHEALKVLFLGKTN